MMGDQQRIPVGDGFKTPETEDWRTQEAGVDHGELLGHTEQNLGGRDTLYCLECQWMHEWIYSTNWDSIKNLKSWNNIKII